MMKLLEPIGILGFGAEGESSLRFLEGTGHRDISVFDRKNGENYMDGLERCRTIVRSAGVYPLQKGILDARARGALLTSQAEMFFEIMREDFPRARVAGVTGTLGKGSCVAMIAHCLEAMGIPHAVGGNFGVPMLDLLRDEGLMRDGRAVIVLELSSFQLMTLRESPHAAVVLQTTSEHLDWHASAEEYREAKANIARWQGEGDFCVFNARSEGAARIAGMSRGAKMPFNVCGDSLEIDGHALRIGECKVLGAHQLQNMAAAALALKGLGFGAGECLGFLRGFGGLEFRLQFAGSRVCGGKRLDFYNDSYSTRPEAAIAAARAMRKPFAMILGGSEKRSDFSELARELARCELLLGAALIGDTARRLEEALKEAGFGRSMGVFGGLEAALNWCVDLLPDGGAALLSPACASFGLFANYKARGRAFNEMAAKFPSLTP